MVKFQPVRSGLSKSNGDTGQYRHIATTVRTKSSVGTDLGRTRQWKFSAAAVRCEWDDRVAGGYKARRCSCNHPAGGGGGRAARPRRMIGVSLEPFVPHAVPIAARANTSTRPQPSTIKLASENV